MTKEQVYFKLKDLISGGIFKAIYENDRFSIFCFEKGNGLVLPPLIT